MTDYATLEELLGYLSLVSSDEDKVVLTQMLARGSQAIDDYTRRAAGAFALAPEEAADLVVYGEDSAVLRLSEFVAGSIESVTGPAGRTPESFVEYRRGRVIGLHSATSDKILTPRVAWERGVPYTVRARWGFAATPGAVKEALLQLVVRWWRTKDEAFSGVIGQLSADHSIIERGFPPGVKNLLDPYVLEELKAEEDEGTIEVGSLFDTDTNPRGGGWGRF